MTRWKDVQLGKFPQLVQVPEFGTISIMTFEQQISEVRSPCPDASTEELTEAQQSLNEYVAAVLRIFDRIGL